MTTMADTAPRYRVLVVDDDLWVAKSIEALLVPEMDVVTCSSGERALRMLQVQDFHVVCADYRMPGLDGITLLAQAAKIREHIGGLLVTGADAQLLSEHRQKHYVLTKPFDPARLLGVVKQLARIADMKRSVEDGPRSSYVPTTPRASTLPAPPPTSRASTVPKPTSTTSPSLGSGRRR